MFFGLVKGIEGMEKFLLCTFFSYDELDIVNQQNIVIPVFFTEFCGGDVVFITDRINQLIRKFL